MCGRFAQTPELSTLFSRFKFFSEDAAGVVPRYNIAPTQKVPIIFRDSEGDHLDSMRWGLVPHWSKEVVSGRPLINARGETVAEKPSFRTPFRRHRCIVPATGFYEWKREGSAKVPYFIRLKDDRPMCFAGLYDRWDAGDGSLLHSFVIITTFPNQLMGTIHDRMPVILSEEDESLWLDPDLHEPKRLKPLLVPCAEEKMDAYPVSTLVNSVAHDSEDCIAEAPEQKDLF